MFDNRYIYLTMEELRAGALVHLISGVDQEPAAPAAAPPTAAPSNLDNNAWLKA